MAEQIDNVKLICGDSAVELKNIHSESIDLTVTSPPYDGLRLYNGYVFDFETIANELFRVTKWGGVCVWVVNDSTVDGTETGTSFRQALYFQSIGFNIHDTMIWKKETSAFPETLRYFQNFEYMFVFSKGRPKAVNLIKDRRNLYCGTKIHGTYRQADGKPQKRSNAWTDCSVSEYGARFNVWEISTEKNNKTGHPAVFPYTLARDHILTWSNEVETVLDPFLGSGTTALAAYDFNRKFIGIEISKDYFELAQSRINEKMAQIRMF